LAVGEFGARLGAAVAAIELARELLNREIVDYPSVRFRSGLEHRLVNCQRIQLAFGAIS
jgi:hypothetical protein